MKYQITIHEFSFNKIKSGSRKIGVHLFDKKAQQSFNAVGFFLKLLIDHRKANHRPEIER